jgi:hypothetical protein
VTNHAVASTFGLPYSPWSSLADSTTNV